MTILLSVTDGTTTVKLSQDDAYLDQFEQVTPGKGADSVYESQRVKFIGGNIAVDDSIQQLIRLFEQARRRQDERIGPRVYVHLSLDGSKTWRSEVMDGGIQMTPAMVKHERATGEREAIVSWQRASYWETVNTYSIALSNLNGTATYDPIRVYTLNDGAPTGDGYYRCNYVDVAHPHLLDGDLPAPLYMTFDTLGRDYSTPYLPNEIHVGVNAFASQDLVYTFEGENGYVSVPPSTTNTVGSDADCSGGEYRETDVSPKRFVRSGMIKWDIYNAHKFSGRRFKLFGNFVGFSIINDYHIQAGMDIINYGVGAPEVAQLFGREYYGRFSSILKAIDLGEFTFPDFRGRSEGTTIEVCLSVWGAGGTYKLDYIEFLPLDSYRLYKLNRLQNIYHHVLIDKDGDTYSLKYSDGNIVGMLTHTPSGELLIYPQRNQRIVIKQIEFNPQQLKFLAVGAKYRPRRRVL